MQIFFFKKAKTKKKLEMKTETKKLFSKNKHNLNQYKHVKNKRGWIFLNIRGCKT